MVLLDAMDANYYADFMCRHEKVYNIEQYAKAVALAGVLFVTHNYGLEKFFGDERTRCRLRRKGI